MRQLLKSLIDCCLEYEDKTAVQVGDNQKLFRLLRKAIGA